MKLATGLRAVVDAFGASPPDAIEHHLRLEAQPPPNPDALAPHEVLVAVRSAAVGWVDLLMTSGQYQHVAQPPYTPGLEFAGEVVATGRAAAQRWSPGDRVIADGLLTGPRSLGAYQQWGGFAGWALAPSDALRALHAGWTFDQGACLLGNYETAYHCLVTRGRLTAGETVLIHGASGSTGLAAVHVAKLVGATVIATGRSAEKLRVVADQGADHVVVLAQPTELRTAVEAIVGRRGVQVVYDGVGGPLSAESLRCLAFGGRFLVVGWAATPDVARGRGERGAPNVNQLPTNLVMMKALDVLGCPTAITTHLHPEIRAPRLAALDAWIAQGRLRPFVERAYPMRQLADAMRAKWRSEHVGGCVVHPWSTD